METFKRRMGNLGEKIAKEYLKKKGYSIIANNFNCLFGEIDLIAQKDNQIIFIEVKTRTTKDYGLPEEAISFNKQQRMLRAAKIYLCKTKRGPIENYRFDAVSVYLNQKGGVDKIEHYENITG